jgi:hypothetical protein
MLFCMCTLLDPESPHAVWSFLNELKNGMGASSNDWLESKGALAGMMWWSDWLSLSWNLLRTHVKAAAVDMEDSSPWAVAASAALSDESSDSLSDEGSDSPSEESSDFPEEPTYDMIESLYRREEALGTIIRNLCIAYNTWIAYRQL